MTKRRGFKRILLIQSPKVRQFGIITPPLGILYLASSLKRNNPGIVVEIVDQIAKWEVAVKERISLFKPDLVGISVLTPARHRALNMAKLIRKKCPKCKIVLGGVHSTLMWSQLMNHYSQIDFIIRGEGEITLSELVKGEDLNKIDGLVWRRGLKSVVNNKDRHLIQNLDDLPFPAWDLVNIYNYQPQGREVDDLVKGVRFPIVFSRGCMGRCTFCSSWRFWKTYRTRSGGKVIEEMELLIKKYNACHFCFVDDTLTGNRLELLNFCKNIIKRRMKVAMIGLTRIDLVDEELLYWMKRAGFYGLSYGIESGSERILESINKRTDLKIIKKNLEITKKIGLQAWALTMYGLPGESAEDRFQTKKLLAEMRPQSEDTIGEVWIFPGTALYERAKAAGLINDKYWLGKRPYYIYRGGLDGDPISWSLRIKDYFRFLVPDSVFKDLLARFYLRITAGKND